MAARAARAAAAMVPMAVIGAAPYAAILLLLDRERVRQFVSFVGHSIRPRGTTD